MSANPLRRLVSGFVRAMPGGLGYSLAFETRSLLGRAFARRLRIDPARTNYMDLGAGDDEIGDFVAVDFFTNGKAYGADLRYPLLIDANVFDGIFTEHTLEHLTYVEVSRLLSECFRILKPGARIRVIVPDLSIFAARYAGDDEAWFSEWEQEVLAPRGRALGSKMEALSFVTQEYGHRSAWDFDTMRGFLARAGFDQIRQCGLREGVDPRLLRDRTDRDRAMVSLYVEAIKPAVSAAPVEGRDGSP
jgi:predicted SAM-dependent methyltransferase